MPHGFISAGKPGGLPGRGWSKGSCGYRLPPHCSRQGVLHFVSIFIVVPNIIYIFKPRQKEKKNSTIRLVQYKHVKYFVIDMCYS